MIIILQEGSRGPEVVDLQYLLKFRGAIPELEIGGFDGIFGPKTKAAVIRFQRAKGLLQDGVVGLNTWTAFGPSWPKQPGDFLREGDRGPEVQRLQQGLNSKGFNAGSTDGIFGSRTKAATIALQKAGGAQDSNREGVVGIFTWGAAIGD